MVFPALVGLSPLEAEAARLDVTSLYTDALVVTRQAHTVSGSGQKTFTETKLYGRGRVVHGAGALAETAMGLVGDSAWTVLADANLVLLPGDEVAAGEWPGKVFLVQSVEIVRMTGPDAIGYHAVAATKRVT